MSTKCNEEKFIQLIYISYRLHIHNRYITCYIISHTHLNCTSHAHYIHIKFAHNLTQSYHPHPQSHTVIHLHTHTHRPSTWAMNRNRSSSACSSAWASSWRASRSALVPWACKGEGVVGVRGGCVVFYRVGLG